MSVGLWEYLAILFPSERNVDCYHKLSQQAIQTQGYKEIPRSSNFFDFNNINLDEYCANIISLIVSVEFLENVLGIHPLNQGCQT